METDLTTGEWDITIRRGDNLTEETATVEVGPTEDNTTPVTITAALAQVRRKPSQNSPVLMELTTSFAGGEVTFGGDLIELDPGVYAWDLQTVSTELGTYTPWSGTFRVKSDVSEEESP